MLWSIDTSQYKVSIDHYHVTIFPAQSLLRSCVFLKLTADQVQVFVWIMGSCQANLLKSEPSSLEASSCLSEKGG